MGDPGGAWRAELFGQSLPALPDLFLPVRTCRGGGHMGPEFLAAAFLFLRQGRFVAVEMNIVGIDAEQQIGTRPRASRCKSGFQAHREQQQGMAGCDCPAEAIRAKKAGRRGITGGAMIVDLRRQCGHLGALARDGVLRRRDLCIHLAQLGLIQRPLPDEQGRPPLRGLRPGNRPVVRQLQLPESGCPGPEHRRGHPRRDIGSFVDRSHCVGPFINLVAHPVTMS